jgi:hypothetical protein
MNMVLFELDPRGPLDGSVRSRRPASRSICRRRQTGARGTAPCQTTVGELEAVHAPAKGGVNCTLYRMRGPSTAMLKSAQEPFRQASCVMAGLNWSGFDALPTELTGGKQTPRRSLRNAARRSSMSQMRESIRQLCKCATNGGNTAEATQSAGVVLEPIRHDE